MSISEIKTELVNSIKGIDMEIAAIRRKFNSELPHIKPQRELNEEVGDFVYLDDNDRLSEILNKVPELKDINVNNIKLVCWVWSNTHNQYYTIDLDYAPTMAYRYNLIIGGKNHGDLVVNGHHDDNANNFDIVYKLHGYLSNEYDTHTSDIREMITDYFDYYDPIKKENQRKIADFDRYIRNHRVKMITEVYKTLANSYSFIIGYTKNGTKLYDVMMRHSGVLLDETIRELNRPNIDPEYLTLCRELNELITSVTSDMTEWYENVDKCIYRIANDKVVNDVRHHILSFV